MNKRTVEVTVTYKLDLNIPESCETRREREEYAESHWEKIMSLGLEGQYYEETEVEVEDL